MPSRTTSAWPRARAVRARLKPRRLYYMYYVDLVHVGLVYHIENFIYYAEVYK